MAHDKDNGPTERPSGEDEIRQIYRVAGYAFLLNLLLAVMKAFLAVFQEASQLLPVQLIQEPMQYRLF